MSLKFHVLKPRNAREKKRDPITHTHQATQSMFAFESKPRLPLRWIKFDKLNSAKVSGWKSLKAIERETEKRRKKVIKCEWQHGTEVIFRTATAAVVVQVVSEREFVVEKEENEEEILVWRPMRLATLASDWERQPERKRKREWAEIKMCVTHNVTMDRFMVR